MEAADDQINDEAAVDAALEDQSVMTGSESEMSSNDQVISMLVGETNNAFTWWVIKAPDPEFPHSSWNG